MKDQIIKIIKKITAKDNITEESTLVDLGIDSLRTMDLLLLLEEEFNLEIDEEFLVPAYFKSVESLIKLVNDVRASKK